MPSIFETTYPQFQSFDVPNIDEFVSIKNIVNKEIEKLRSEKIINSSQQAKIKLWLPNNLNHWSKKLKNFLMVGQLEIIEGDLKAEARKFEDGFKCERCWKYVVSSEVKNSICKTCQRVLEK